MCDNSIFYIGFRQVCLALVILVGHSCSRRTELMTDPAINRVKKGEKLLLILPEDHRDGYTWTMKEDFDKNVIVHKQTVWKGNEKGLYYYFETRAPGRTYLTFVKRKYVDTSDIKHVTVLVDE